MKKILLVLAVALYSSLTFGQGFTPGNLVVFRFGNGTDQLPADKVTVPVFLDEYDLNGNKVSTLAMPVAPDDVTENRVLSGGVLSDVEGLISLSPNGHFLTVIGHSVPPYTTEYSGGIVRTIGVVTADGVINTRAAVRGNVGNARHAITHNGGSLWFVGSANGLKFKPINTIAANDSVLIGSPGAHTSVYIFNNQLYYVSYNGKRIAKVGDGLPVNPDQTATSLPGYPNTGSPDQIVMFDADPVSPEPDLMYVTESTTGTLYKWRFNGSAWEEAGSVQVPGVTDGIRGLTGRLSGSDVSLYVTNPSTVLSFTDPSALTSTFNATLNAPQVLVQAQANTLLRGVAFTPGTTETKPNADVSSSQFASLIQSKTDIIQELKTNETFQRYPGVEETNLTFTSNRGVPIAMFFLKVDLDNPNVALEAMMPNNSTTYALQTIRQMIAHKNAGMSDRQVVAGSNGDYYSWTGEPDGTVHINGQIIKELPDGKFFFGVKHDGTAVVGDKRIYDAVKPDVKEALAGRFFLMRYGEIMTDHIKDVSIEPRSTVGILSPTKVVFMWVDGRRAGHSAGISLADMARIYKAIGVTDAINIDGGGSTTFLMRNPDGTYEARNRPSDGSERSVANGWAVTVKNTVLSNRKDLNNSNTAFVLPNPVTNQVQLTIKAEAPNQQLELQLMSTDGKIIFAQKGTLENLNAQLNQQLAGLKAGVYLLNATGAKGTYTSRFVKQ